MKKLKLGVSFLVITAILGDNQADDLLPSASSGKEVHVKVPVFHVGELLIVDSIYKREVAYPGRKASKWPVKYEIFPIDQLFKAIARAREVFEKTLG